MARQCVVTGCENKSLSRGFCKKHYSQMIKHGRIFRTRFEPNELVEYEDCFGVILVDRGLRKIAETFVDKADIEWVRQYKWYLNTNGYVMTHTGGAEKYLHKLMLLDAKQVDHKDRDRLNNRRSNLRRCDSFENARNSSKNSLNTSGITGVQWHAATKRWRAFIHSNKRNIHLGLYDNFEDAKAKRKQAEQEYFGEFAPS